MVIILKKKEFKLNTSFLNLCEMSRVLIEDIVMRRMYLEGIPFGYYNDYLSKFLKEKNFKKELDKIINKYYLHIVKNELWIIHTLKMIEIKDFKEIDKLRIDFNLPFADALIFFTATKQGGYFVTTDSHHFLDNKKLKDEYKSKIQIISPTKANEILKNPFRKDFKEIRRK